MPLVINGTEKNSRLSNSNLLFLLARKTLRHDSSLQGSKRQKYNLDVYFDRLSSRHVPIRLNLKLEINLPLLGSLDLVWMSH